MPFTKIVRCNESSPSIFEAIPRIVSIDVIEIRLCFKRVKYFRHRAGAQHLVIAEQPAILTGCQLIYKREQIWDTAYVFVILMVTKRPKLSRPIDDLPRV